MLNPRLFVLLSVLLSTLIFQVPVSASSQTTPKLIKAQAQAEAKTDSKIESKTLDPRAEILQAYLAKHNSPLQYHSQDFIDAADTYNLDWKLVPAISGVESTFGKRIPGGYNGWGWGVYGDQSLGFRSWRDGIFTVSKGLKSGYIDRGLTNPYLMGKRYAASPTWATNVDFFLKDITKFEQDYTSS